MKYGEALDLLERGMVLTREGWFGKHFIFLVDPEPGELVNVPYVTIRDQIGRRVPWLCSQTDGLERDWVLKNDWREGLDQEEIDLILDHKVPLEGVRPRVRPRFKVGQRVLYEGGGWKEFNGQKGTVSLVLEDGSVGVEFDCGKETGVDPTCLTLLKEEE